MKEEHEKSLFHIGMRNFKTGLAVFFCLIAYAVVGREGTSLACTSAIICMQDSVEKSVISGRNRLIGTVFGALLGMLLLYLNLYIPSVDLTFVTGTVGTMLLILFCNIIRKPDAIVIGCVVLLVIILQQTDQSPLVDSVNRLIDTFVGIFIAVAVNRFVRNPSRRSRKNEDQTKAAAEPEPLPSGDDTGTDTDLSGKEKEGGNR